MADFLLVYFLVGILLLAITMIIEYRYEENEPESPGDYGILDYLGWKCSRCRTMWNNGWHYCQCRVCKENLTPNKTACLSFSGFTAIFMIVGWPLAILMFAFIFPWKKWARNSC